MLRNLATTVLVATMALTFSGAGLAGPREDQLARYASAAKAANPAFSGFSADRGNTLYTKNFAGGKPDTPACTSCHGKDPRAAGRTLTGKTIDPVALSAAPSRYTDPAKVEKWFKRNCNDTLGRECTSAEKADFVAYLLSPGSRGTR